MSLLYEDITEAIIGSAYEVHNILGYGFLEKVYQKALQVELARRGHSAAIERSIKVEFKGAIVGEYEADLLVDEKVIVELKVAKEPTRYKALLCNAIRSETPVSQGWEEAELL